MKLPGMDVPVFNRPVLFTFPLFVSPIAKICGCVPFVGAALKVLKNDESIFMTTCVADGIVKTRPESSLISYSRQTAGIVNRTSWPIT